SRSRYALCVLFFFFQAEDGIRDWSVTGVQTCALPIYPRDVRSPPRRRRRRVEHAGRRAAIARGPRRQRVLPYALRARRRGAGPRSEERRVGKEGRARWWP